MTETENISGSVRLGSSNNKEKDVFITMKKKYTRMKKNIKKLMTDYRLYENAEKVATYLISHPVLLTVCISILAIFIIPILLFIIFAVVNVAFAFTGFVVVLVVVLTIGTTTLCSILFSFFMVIVITGIYVLFIWSLSCYLLSMIRNFGIIT